MPEEIQAIHKPHIIFCEGMDEKWFLIHFLNAPELAGDPFYAQEVQVIDFGGNDELRDKLHLLQLTPGFEQVKSLLILRDGETNAQQAVRRIQSSLEKEGFPVPEGPGEWAGGKPKVGFLLFPCCDKSVIEGTLEDLCLSILKGGEYPDVLKEISVFLDHLHDVRGRSFRHEFKTKLHTYFSVTDDLVGLKIGEAAKVGAFDWSSERLTYLKEFLIINQ